MFQCGAECTLVCSFQVYKTAAVGSVDVFPFINLRIEHVFEVVNPYVKDRLSPQHKACIEQNALPLLTLIFGQWISIEYSFFRANLAPVRGWSESRHVATELLDSVRGPEI